MKENKIFPVIFQQVKKTKGHDSPIGSGSRFRALSRGNERDGAPEAVKPPLSAGCLRRSAWEAPANIFIDFHFHLQDNKNAKKKRNPQGGACHEKDSGNESFVTGTSGKIDNQDSHACERGNDATAE
ncbi:MAG TPA: hypothetical protein VIU40_09675 [Geobacteraceae bacterium]